MAKKYRITEAQYKEVLNHLTISEAEMKACFDYNLNEITLEEFQGEKALAFLFKEGGTDRVFKGSLGVYDLQQMGYNTSSLIKEFKRSGKIDEALYTKVLATAELDLPIL